MAEPRNGLTSLLRVWPILVTVLSIVGGLISWQFLSLHGAVQVLQREHLQAMPLAQKVPGLGETLRTIEMEQARWAPKIEEIDELRKSVTQLQITIETRQTVVAVVDTRLTNVERELQAMRGILEDIRRGMAVRGP